MTTLDSTRAADLGRDAARDDLSYAGTYRSENPYPSNADWWESHCEWQAAYDATVEAERGFGRFKAVLSEMAEYYRIGDTCPEIIIPKVAI